MPTPRNYLIIVFVLLAALMAVSFTTAQDTAEVEEFSGLLVSWEGSTMIVEGRIVNTDAANIGEGVAVGENITVIATTDDNIIWTATSISLAEPVEPVVAISLEGPVESVDGNVIQVGGFAVILPEGETAPEVGAMVAVEGELGEDDTGRTVVFATSVTPVGELPDDGDGDESSDTGTDINLNIDGGTIIVIEGPVDTINVNVVSIFGFDVNLGEDPLVAAIQIGDVIRVNGLIEDGDFDFDGDTVIIVVANEFTIINVEIEINIIDGNFFFFRNDARCNNPPPPWAVANGWRRKCEGGGSGRGSGS